MLAVNASLKFLLKNLFVEYNFPYKDAKILIFNNQRSDEMCNRRNFVQFFIFDFLIQFKIHYSAQFIGVICGDGNIERACLLKSVKQIL